MISINTTFNASAEKVWKAWTNEDLITKWFGSDPEGRVLKAKLDVRPAGYFEITFNDADLTEHTCSGIYKDVEEYSKLTFSWKWKNEPGVESFVTLSLTSECNITLMHFEHSNFGNASKHEYLKGWQQTFLKLERILAM